MTKRTEVKELIYEILQDGKVHETDEIRKRAIAKGVVSDDEQGVIRSVIHQLKKNDARIITEGRGKYRMFTEVENVQNAFEQLVMLYGQEIDRLSKLDWVNCSDDEIVEGRKHISELKKYNDKLSKIGRH